MDLKSLSELNRVVIIDNDEDQGFAISKALNKEGVASFFYQFNGVGNLGDVPKCPNARLVFLDLGLDPLLGTGNDTEKATLALTCLSRVVEPSSFYILVVWSAQLDTLGLEFNRLLQERGKDFYPCIPPIVIDKNDCADPSSSNGYLSSVINKKLNEGLRGAEKFGLFTLWERKISGVTSSFLRDLISSEETAETISGKINALSFAQAGEGSNNPSLHALLTLNDSFKGTIDTALVSEDYSIHNAAVNTDSRCDVIAMSNINTTLTVNPNKAGPIGPGCVIKVKEDLLANGLIRGDQRTSVIIDITALCDVAQGNNEFHHFVHGVLLPSGNNNDSGKQKVFKLNGTFSLDDDRWRLFINLASVIAKTKDEVAAMPSEDIWFRLRDNAVIELQQRIASYNSRPGRVILTDH
jgi:hypothetical protein